MGCKARNRGHPGIDSQEGPEQAQQEDATQRDKNGGTGDAGERPGGMVLLGGQQRRNVPPDAPTGPAPWKGLV